MKWGKVMDRLERIRLEEKTYHDVCYTEHELFKKGTWLHKPVKTVVDLLPRFTGKKEAKVLDLGCGVGRNSIPIAQALRNSSSHVVCVDFLDSAITNLKKYSEQFGVEQVIQAEKSDIATFEISNQEYDFIVAVSSLEHLASEHQLDEVLQQMSHGTKSHGINCIIVNSEVEEINVETNEHMEPMMELNFSTPTMMEKLNQVYQDQEWKVLTSLVKPLKFQITRNGTTILLKTNAITYVVKKN